MSEADPELPDIEFYTLPDLSDLEFWDRFMAAGLHQPEPEPPPKRPGWDWLDLTDPAYAIKPDPPAILDLLYHGKRHVISGPPESAKTLVAYLLLLEALRQGEGVAIIDFEMGPHAAVTLLRELGATDDELTQIHYTEPEGPPEARDTERIVGLGVGFCLVDAAAGAYNAQGLDDNARKDAEQFAGRWIRPLWQAGVSTILIDHVVKNADNRGKFTIGSERKTGQADVHLSLEALQPLTRGKSGIIKATVHKDRPGFLPRPTACMFNLTSDPDTHQITWEQKEPIPTEPVTGEFRHTIYMERISRVMERIPGHAWSKKQLEEDVEGKRDYIRAALDELLTDGHVVATEDGKNLRYTLVEPWGRPVAPGSPQGRPGEGATNLAPSPLSLREGEAMGRAAKGDENDGAGATLETLLEKYDEELK